MGEEPQAMRIISVKTVMEPQFTTAAAAAGGFCCCLVAKLCPTLCNPMDCSPPGFFVHEISQARILEWVAISYSRGFSQPKDRNGVSCSSLTLQADSLLLNHWRRERQPTAVFLPGKSHGQRSLVGYSPWDHKESEMTKQLNNKLQIY